MELENANANGCNVVMNNQHPMILFFWKWLKIELKKGLQSLLQSRDSIKFAPKQKLLIMYISLMKMEWFESFHVYRNLEYHFQNFFSLKKLFFWVAQATQSIEEKTT